MFAYRPSQSLTVSVLALLLQAAPTPAQGTPPGGNPSGSSRIVEASAPKVTPLVEGWGRLERGDQVPEIALERPDGTRLELQALAGAPVILCLTLGSIVPAGLDEIATRSSRYGVPTIAVVVYANEPEFENWLRERPAARDWLPVRDAAGAFVPADAERNDPLERAHWHETTLIGRIYHRGTAPRMPVYVVLDAAGRVVGYCSAQHARDGTAHLLQLAGIDFAPEDRPASAAKILAAGGPRTPSELRAAGTEAPDFPMTDAAGQRVALADLRGKVIVLEFWATWCGPCLLAMPHAQELARTYREQGVVVIASCTRDEREKFEAWVAVHGADYPDVVFAHDPLAMGEDRAAKVHYGVDGIPVQFVLDREGRVIGSIKGYFPGEVLLDAMLARAGIAVDPKVLEKAAEDERLRGWRKGGTAAPADGSPQGVTPLGGGEVRVIRR